MVKALAAIRLGKSFYFIFPWAEEGNLLDLWRKDDATELSASRVYWFLDEISHLSLAISKLHSREYGRHGDLKPENILCFRGEDSQTMLYIADMGLVKFHSTSTEVRSHPTRTIGGTWKYCPPEELTTLREQRKRSRVYDVWSMGCIYLEFVVWLLYGYNKLNSWKSQFERFFSLMRTADGTTPVLHNQVQTWMEYMRRSDIRCKGNTALGDVLTLVESRLLRVNIDSEGQDFRAQSTEMYTSIEEIRNKAKSDSSYLFSGPTTFPSPDSDPSTQRSLSPIPRGRDLQASMTGIRRLSVSRTLETTQDQNAVNQESFHSRQQFDRPTSPVPAIQISDTNDRHSNESLASRLAPVSIFHSPVQL